MLIIQNELLKLCYEWQTGNAKQDFRTVYLRYELDKTGLECIWLDGEWTGLRDRCQVIKMTCEEMQRLSSIEKMGDKRSAVSYWNMKEE